MLILLVGLLGGLAQAGQFFHMGLKNYSEIKEDNKPLVVLYFGSDRNSKKFREEYLKVADGSHELLKKQQLPEELNFGIVDADVEKKLMEKTQIVLLPTVYLFLDDSNKVRYENNWNAMAFIGWVKKTIRENPTTTQWHPSSIVSKFEGLQKKFQMFNLVAMLVTPEYRLAPLKTFTQAIKQLPDGFVFCHIHDTKLAGILGVDKEESQLLVYSKIEDLSEDVSDEDKKKWATFTYRYTGDLRDVTEMKEWLDIYSWRGFYHLDDTKWQKFSRKKDRFPMIALVYNKSIPEQRRLEKDIQAVRSKFVRKCVLGLIDASTDMKERLDRIYALNVTRDTPKLIAMKPISDDNYEKFISDTLDPAQFWENISSGKAKPFVKSQHFDQDQLYDKAGVRKLTAETYYPFIEEANKNSQDVVVFYTAKQCNPCKEFMPYYHTITKQYKSILEGKVHFTKIDIYENDLDFQITAFPYAKLYKAGLDKPLNKITDFTEEQFLSWVKDQSNYGHLLPKVDL